MNNSEQNRLELLAALPLILNSSLEHKEIVRKTIEHSRKILNAEAATVFSYAPGSKEISFWALSAADGNTNLEGKKMPADKGVVGWVIKHQRSVLISDSKKDPRFFSEIDRESLFDTRDLICVPLTSRRSHRLGALQILNSLGPEKFTQQDLEFTEKFAEQLSLALENARLFEELQQDKHKLETLDRRKKEMITVITHELRTPLGIIRSSAELLASDMLKDQAAKQRISEALFKGVDRISRLTSEIKEFAALGSGKLELTLQEVNLPDLCEQLHERFNAGIQTRKLQYSCIIAPNASRVKADAALLLIVLSKLLSNAIRFTADGGAISLELTRSAGMINFSISDSGIGIAAEQIELIFEKFYEVGDAMQHSSGTHEFKSGGLGLGLSTVKEILKAHGSSIEVKSQLGKGSCFKFALAAA